MNDDDLRHALSAYAATAPDLDPRDGLAGRVARHERARRAAIATVAGFAVLVAGAGVATLSRGHDTAGLVASENLPGGSGTPSPTGSPEESPGETPPPSPSHDSGSGPAPSGAPGSATATAPPPRPVDTSPTTHTAGGPDGLRVRVTLRPGSFPTATLGRLEVHAVDDDAQPQVTMVSWGDTGSAPYSVRSDVCTLPGNPYPTLTPAPEEPPAAGDIDAVFEHAYRHAGRYLIQVHVTSSRPCDGDAAEEQQMVEFDFDVTQGQAMSNGPAEPGAELSMREDDGDMLRRHLTAHINDPDGYVGEAVVDWGDGSPVTTIRNPDACDDGKGAHYPGDAWFGVREIQHDYEAGGEYTVTVTVVSAGCDGADRQRVAERLVVEVA